MIRPIDPLFPPPRPSKFSAGRILFFLVLAAAALVLWKVRPFKAPVIVRVQVRKGVPARVIANDLYEQGLLVHPWSFLVWVRLLGHTGAIKPGLYDLSTRQTGLGMLETFHRGPPLVRITFPEGWTARQMAALLETRGITTAAEFSAAALAQKREGFLFPDTYFFEQGLSPQQVITRLVDRFNQKEPADFKTQAAALKLSYVQLVTLASIVEKEARLPQERPLIAGVYLNRLRRHMYLEADPTVQYALGEQKPKLYYKDLQIVSPYNTYRHAGLPPGPICNPGAAALAAASHPEKTEMLFFVADGQGGHRFSRDYKEHMAIQKKKPS